MISRKSRKQPAKDTPRPPDDHPPIDIAVQRRLRRDLGLTTKEIEAIDIEIAIEAGLLNRPRR